MYITYIMAELVLSKAELRAITLLRNTPEEIQRIAKPDGTISIDDLYNFYVTLVRGMEQSRIRRKEEYIDVEKTAVVS